MFLNDTYNPDSLKVVPNLLYLSYPIRGARGKQYLSISSIVPPSCPLIYSLLFNAFRSINNSFGLSLCFQSICQCFRLTLVVSILDKLDKFSLSTSFELEKRGGMDPSQFSRLFVVILVYLRKRIR